MKSERIPDTTHAIYWDSEKIYDPDPLVKIFKPLSDYDILAWIPIIKLKFSAI